MEAWEGDFVSQRSYVIRFLYSFIGLVLFGFGVHLYIKANIGLSPWAAFTIGLSYVTGASFGDVAIGLGLIVLLLVTLLKEKFGVATVMNIIIVGKMVDFFMATDFIPMQNAFWAGVLTLVAGQFIVSFATYFYISPGLGSGPRDALMIALGKRLPHLPIGLVRGGLEGIVLTCGWLLGAKVGLGTLIFVLSIGFILQTVFHLLKFDVKAVVHESVEETWKNIKASKGSTI